MSRAGQRVIAVVVEDHYTATAGGVFARRGMGHPYAYYRQFHDLFDQVVVIARVARARQRDPSWPRADGPGVRFLPVRDHAGLGAAARMLPHTLAVMARGLRAADYVFIRGGGPMSTLAWMCLRALGTPYARQVVGRDGEATRFALRHRPRPVRTTIAAAADWLARRQIAGAAAVAYVAPALKHSYPPGPGAPVFHYSDVHLSADVVTGPRPAESFSAAPLRLVSVGRLTAEKGHRVLLQALAVLDRQGARGWTLEVIGPGPEAAALERLAAALGLADRLRLAGELPWGPALFARLDHADLFVLPSLTEGLPRAMLEALSRGVPAVGTRVGGVPGVLDDLALAPPGDAAALAACIRPFMGDRDRLAAASARGFAAAMCWHPDTMDAQKQAFWRALRQRTDAWRDRR